jgi:flagellar hook-basal body complex protein FliE
VIAPLAAANAYAAVQGAAPPVAVGAASPPAGADFGQMVTSAIQDAVGQSRNAETQMAAQVQGKASLVDVVTAISSAETSLQTLISIRDQVIASYQQIMNMAI